MKKCPPGVICIENISMVFIIICIAIVLYLVYANLNKNSIQITNQPSEKIFIKQQRENGYGYGLPNYPYNNFPENVLMNPNSPPLSDERYLIPSLNYMPPGSMPINISTNVNAVETAYRQVGIFPQNPKTPNYEKFKIMKINYEITFKYRVLSPISELYLKVHPLFLQYFEITQLFCLVC